MQNAFTSRRLAQNNFEAFKQVVRLEGGYKGFIRRKKLKSCDHYKTL